MYEKFRPTTNEDAAIAQLQNNTNAQLNVEQTKYVTKSKERERFGEAVSGLADTAVKARNAYEKNEADNALLEEQQDAANLEAKANSIANDNSKPIEERLALQKQLYEQKRLDIENKKKEAERSPWWGSPENALRKRAFAQGLAAENQKNLDFYDTAVAKLESEKNVQLLSQSPDKIASQQNFIGVTKAVHQATREVMASTNLTPAQKEQIKDKIKDTAYKTNQNIRLKEGDALEKREDSAALYYYDKEISVLQKEVDKNPFANEQIYQLQTKRDAYQKSIAEKKNRTIINLHTDFIANDLPKSVDNLRSSSEYKEADTETKVSLEQNLYYAKSQFDKDPTKYMLERNSEYLNNRVSMARSYEKTGTPHSVLSKKEQAPLQHALKTSLNEKEIFGQFDLLERVLGNEGEKSAPEISQIKKLAVSESKKIFEPGLDQMLAESYINEDYGKASKLMAVKIAKNKQGGSIPDTDSKKFNDPKVNYTKNGSRARYNAMLNTKDATSETTALTDYMKYYRKTKVEAQEELFGKSTKYITDPFVVVSFDTSKGVSDTSVKNYLNHLLNDPSKTLDERQTPRDFLNLRGSPSNPNARIYDVDNEWIALSIQDPTNGRKNTVRYISKEQMYQDIQAKSNK